VGDFGTKMLLFQTVIVKSIVALSGCFILLAVFLKKRRDKYRLEKIYKKRRASFAGTTCLCPSFAKCYGMTTQGYGKARIRRRRNPSSINFV